MAEISKTYTNFWGGISDDAFIGSENSVASMDGIEVQLNERFATAQLSYISAEYWDMNTPEWIKSTPSGVFLSDTSYLRLPGGGQRSFAMGALTNLASYGSGLDQVNYLFGQTGGIQKLNWNGFTNIGSPITSGYPTENVGVYATGWHATNLLFSKGNKIYFLDIDTEFCSLAVLLMPGTNVKFIYSYSYESTVVVGTNGNNTMIYEIEFTGGAYNIVSMTPIIGEKALGAVGDKYNVFWISERGIHMYQGRQDQLVRYLSLPQGAKIGFDDGVIISTGTTLYSYRRRKPSQNYILTAIGMPYYITAIEGSAIVSNIGNSRYARQALSSAKRTNYILLRPLDGGIYNIPKSDLSFRFGYMFDMGAYSNVATPQEIEVQIQTDTMEMQGVSYISIGMVTDRDTGIDSIGNPKCGYMEITPNMVKNALQTAGFPSEFGYVRTNIILKSGDEFSGNPGFFRKAPRLFDFSIFANYVKR